MTVKPVLWMVAVAGLLASPPATANDKVSIIMSWVAEAEHGGFYQALATGIYTKHGLDVTIRQGGPQLNTGQMLAAGAIDFRVGGGSGGTLNFVQNDVPAMAVAAIFQKEAAVLIAHPGAGINSVAVGLIGREHRHHAGDAHFIDALHPVKIFA